MHTNKKTHLPQKQTHLNIDIGITHTYVNARTLKKKYIWKQRHINIHTNKYIYKGRHIGTYKNKQINAYKPIYT